LVVVIVVVIVVIVVVIVVIVVVVIVVIVVIVVVIVVLIRDVHTSINRTTFSDSRISWFRYFNSSGTKLSCTSSSAKSLN
jgi:uncharacterized membrane protein